MAANGLPASESSAAPTVASAVVTNSDHSTRCRVCHKPREQHGDLHHEFSEDGRLVKKASRPTAPTVAETRRTSSTPVSGRGDPVLRLLLMRLGVIKPDELAKIEEELMVAGVAYASDSSIDTDAGDGRADIGDRAE